MKPFDVYPLYDIKPVRAEGSYLYDEKGQKYTDLYGGHAVISVGHSHPHYIRRISEQLNNIAFYSNSVLNDLQTELAEKLGKISGYADYSLFLCNSGAEANENAIKLASFHNKRKKIIAFERSFHGRTEAAVSITDNPAIISPANQRENVVFLPLNDLEALEKEIRKGDICAVVVEGIQGWSGIYEPTVEFLQTAQKLCSEYGTVLILDEIQSGYGRTGKFFAHQFANILPDMITVAKGMANGFPIGGVLISPAFEAVKGSLGTTFGGNHLACAAALAVLEIIEQENLLAEVEQKGEILITKLRGLERVKEVRGRGLMLGIELPFSSKTIRENLLFEDHIFVGSAHQAHTIRLLPALNVPQEALDDFVEILAKSIQLT